MTSSVAVSPALPEAASAPGSEAASPSGGKAAPRSGARKVAVLVATVLTLGSVGGVGYTQWWVPKQEAQEVARVAYDRCVDEVKAYEGTASYTDRLNQCADLYAAS
jgi:hypothetical protein